MRTLSCKDLQSIQKAFEIPDYYQLVFTRIDGRAHLPPKVCITVYCEQLKVRDWHQCHLGNGPINHFMNSGSSSSRCCLMPK